MWSRKPTPVARVPGARAVERRAQADVGLLRLARSISAVRRHRAGHSRARAPSTPRGRSKPSARAIGAPARASAAAAAPMRTSAHAPAEVRAPTAPRRSAPRRRSAARGWSPRRSRRTPSPLAAPTNTQPALRTRGASASAPAPDELQVLGRERLGERRAPSSSVGDVRRARAAASLVPSRVERAPRRASSSAASSADRAPRSCPRRARPAPAGRARRARGRRPRSASTSTSLGPAKPSMPDVAGDLALGLLHVEAARPGDDVDARDRLGAVGQRGDRRARRPCA